MEDIKWHVSDSEDELVAEHYTQLNMSSHLKGLCEIPVPDIYYASHSQQLCIPKNLNALYKQIENNGFISLQCEGSKRRVETIIKNDNTNNHNSTSCIGGVINKPEVVETQDEALRAVAKPVSKNEFDYDEDIMDTTPVVRLHKRKPKSDHYKYQKTKRVGTMEKVINNINRFERLNAQAMAADAQQ